MSPHFSDRELMLFLDGEGAHTVGQHLDNCAACRCRLEELTEASREFEHQYRKLQPAPSAGARADFLARLRQEQMPGRGVRSWKVAAAIAAGFVLAVVAWRSQRLAERTEFAPVPSLTPGVTRPVSLAAICSPAERPALRRVSDAVAEQVFRRYGIRSPRPRSYEIDYLIPPDLGGSEDPGNLWPQPYARGVWNARVKDALEDRLRSQVCDGKLDLVTAQRELARDWIGAYKRNFQTDKPLLDHVAFYKDSPWE